MISPLTCICVLLAGGAGLYLYQEKHQAQMLDREIAATVHATALAHERTGILRAEWQLLNEPGRLSQLADRFLVLKTTTPGQFTTFADLNARLPPPRAPQTAPAEPDLDQQDAPAAPLASAAEPAKPTPSAKSSSPSQNTAALAAAATAKIAAAARPAEARTKTARAEPRALPEEPAPPVVTHTQPHPQPPRLPPQETVQAQVVTTSLLAARYVRPAVSEEAQGSGSALGMARSMLPLPMPVAPARPTFVNPANPAEQQGGG